MSTAKPYRDIVINSKSELVKLKPFIDSLPRVNKKLKRFLVSNNAYVSYYTEYLYDLALSHVKMLYLYNRTDFTKHIKIGCRIKNSVFFITLKYLGLEYDMVETALKSDRSSYSIGQSTGGIGFKLIQDDYKQGYLVSHTYHYDKSTGVNTIVLGYQIDGFNIKITEFPEKEYLFNLDTSLSDGNFLMSDIGMFFYKGGTYTPYTDIESERFYLFGKTSALAEIIYNILCYSNGVPSLSVHLEDSNSTLNLTCKIPNMTKEFISYISKSIRGFAVSIDINRELCDVNISYKYSIALRRYI